MIWPPVKAWTSKFDIDDQVHFVAINYGGKLQNRWVIMMSVIDSSVLIKVFWSTLVDSSKWKMGWDEINHADSFKLIDNKSVFKDTELSCLSNDSGLTIPISKYNIRPWFE